MVVGALTCRGLHPPRQVPTLLTLVSLLTPLSRRTLVSMVSPPKVEGGRTLQPHMWRTPALCSRPLMHGQGSMFQASLSIPCILVWHLQSPALPSPWQPLCSHSAWRLLACLNQ